MTTVEESVTETREDIPLNRRKKSTSWYRCNDDCLSGAKFINLAFGTLTFVISVALLVQIEYGDYQVVPHGSVATDRLECSEIGASILKQGGNAVDAAIASTFCLSVTNPHVTGLDAQGQLLIYNHRTRLLPNVIDFSGSTVISDRIPRLVLGLAYTHQQYGSLAWKELVLPAAKIARQGFPISKMLVQAISRAKAEDLYGYLEAGKTLKIENLPETLGKIANMSEEELYGYIESKNQPVKSQAIKDSFNNYNIYVPNIPSIGPLLLTNLQEIEKFNFTKEDTMKPEYVYRLADVTQIMYKQLDVDSKFDEGTTTNVAVIDKDDNYVSLVTGMYGLFGSRVMTSLGYVLDANKTKTCSRLPLIVTDSNFVCGRRMVFGSNDMATALQLITALLIANENVTEGIEAPRFHFNNGTIETEGSHLPAFKEDVLTYLKTLSPDLPLTAEPYVSSNIVEKFKDDLSSHSDSRGGGIASRF